MVAYNPGRLSTFPQHTHTHTHTHTGVPSEENTLNIAEINIAGYLTEVMVSIAALSFCT